MLSQKLLIGPEIVTVCGDQSTRHIRCYRLSIHLQYKLQFMLYWYLRYVETENRDNMATVVETDLELEMYSLHNTI